MALPEWSQTNNLALSFTPLQQGETNYEALLRLCPTCRIVAQTDAENIAFIENGDRTYEVSLYVLDTATGRRTPATPVVIDDPDRLPTLYSSIVALLFALDTKKLEKDGFSGKVKAQKPDKPVDVPPPVVQPTPRVQEPPYHSLPTDFYTT